MRAKKISGAEQQAPCASAAAASAATKVWRQYRAKKELMGGVMTERDTGAALLGHLVTVERGTTEGRLAGDVDQDGRGRPPHPAP